MKPKATHKGHCQVCKSEQKLPGGVIARHGYKHPEGSHSFVGTCQGSGHPPIEVSRDRIEEVIKMYQIKIGNFEKHNAEIVAGKKVGSAAGPYADYAEVFVENGFYCYKRGPRSEILCSVLNPESDVGIFTVQRSRTVMALNEGMIKQYRLGIAYLEKLYADWAAGEIQPL